MLLESVASAEVRRGERDIFLSASHSHLEWKRFRFLKETYRTDRMPRKNGEGPRGITTAKRDNIVSKLCPVMARTGHLLRTQYWQSIATNEESVDLCASRDRGEGEAVDAADPTAP